VVADLSRVYEEYHHRVHAYAAKLIGRDAADDVVQDVFVKVGRSLKALAEPRKLASWIYAITLNTVRDEARKRCSRAEAPLGDAGSGSDDLDPFSRIPDTVSRTPEEAAIRNEMVACYLDYVKQLPRRYYEVYVLSEFAEVPDETIARRLRVSVGTVKIRLHRARARLYGALRRDCRCYRNRRGELAGEPKSPLSSRPRKPPPAPGSPGSFRSRRPPSRG
jgi:RNA polymerase sigma-70 factor (ECF subfamily)